MEKAVEDVFMLARSSDVGPNPTIYAIKCSMAWFQFILGSFITTYTTSDGSCLWSENVKTYNEEASSIIQSTIISINRKSCWYTKYPTSRVAVHIAGAGDNKFHLDYDMQLDSSAFLVVYPLELLVFLLPPFEFALLLLIVLTMMELKMLVV